MLILCQMCAATISSEKNVIEVVSEKLTRHEKNGMYPLEES